jgi:hypothetical protein
MLACSIPKKMIGFRKMHNLRHLFLLHEKNQGCPSSNLAGHCALVDASTGKVGLA